jgi:hypothetical protein
MRMYNTMILPLVLYGCEIWSLTVREEDRLRAFENRVLRRIFGLKRVQVTGGWRKLHNEELCIIGMVKSRRMKWAGHAAQMGEKMNAYRLLVGKQEEKSTLGRPRRRWVDNNRKDLVEVGWDDED